MADLHALARKYAKQAGIDPDIFARQIQQESGFNPNARSPAGAIGVAQIMPATARGWGVDPTNPRASLKAAAQHMAAYQRQYGSVRDALVAYNAGPGRVGKSLPAETRHYIDVILGGKGGGDTSSMPSRRSSVPLSAPTSRFDAQGFSKAQMRVQILTGLLSHGNPNTHNPLVKFGLLEPKRSDFTRTVPGVRTGATSRSPAAVAAPTGKGTFKITGSNPGRLKPSVIQFAKRVAAVYGQPITGDSGATHSKYTTTGGVSQHWTGNATDIPAAGNKLLRLGRAALIAAGMPRKQAMKQNGGLYNFPNGVQVIFRTMEGGNHWNHLHISHG